MLHAKEPNVANMYCYSVMMKKVINSWTHKVERQPEQ